MKNYLIVATKEELDLPFAAAAIHVGYRQPIVTGVGATNVISSLRNLPSRCVVDMELAYIAAFGFQSLKAVKYVSDNLNQYEQCLKK